MNTTNTDYEIIRETFGYAGGIITVIKIIPQIIKIFKTKSAKDISMIFLILGIFGGIFMIIYGLMLQEFPIIIRSSVMLTQIIIIFIAKIYFDNKNNTNTNTNIEI